MFAKPVAPIKLEINPLTCWMSKVAILQEGACLENLLRLWRERPRTVFEYIEFTDHTPPIIKPLSNQTLKLQKYNHSKCKKPYTASYFSQDKDGAWLEYRLEHPIKKQSQTMFPAVGDTYMVYHDFLGRGTFGKVTAGNVLYWYDTNDILNGDTINPVARKTIRLVDADDDSYIGEETAAKLYLGNDNVQHYIRTNNRGLRVFELSMPMQPHTLDKIVNSGQISEYSFSDQLQLLINIAREIRNFHNMTNMAHHDIKPENITVNDNDLSVKLIDFGLANPLGSHAGVCGPKRRIDNRLSPSNSVSETANDYFSFASTIAFVLLHNYDFIDRNNNYHFDMLKNSCPSQMSNKLIYLLEGMTTSQGKRLSADEIITTLEELHAEVVHDEQNICAPGMQVRIF